jgi:hypothetical protein
MLKSYIQVIWSGLVLGAMALQADCKFAICSVFRDEEPFLLEWIDYHRAIGCNKFVLFNDSGSKKTRSKTAELLLQEHIASGLVELRYRDECYGTNEKQFLNGSAAHVGFQMHVYNLVCRESKGKYDWVACIDLDEYIRPIGRANFTDLLEAEYRDAGGVFLSWLCFGTAGKTLALGSSMLTQLTARTYDWDPENCQGKSIVRPEAFSKMGYLHYGQVKDGYFYRDGNGQAMIWQGVHLQHPNHCSKLAVLHHYVFRDVRHFNEVKLPRQKQFWNQERINEWMFRFEQIQDNSMVEYIRIFHPDLFDKMNSNFYETAYARALIDANITHAEARSWPAKD